MHCVMVLFHAVRQLRVAPFPRVYQQTLVSKLYTTGLVQNWMRSKFIQVLHHLTCVSLWVLFENINQTCSVCYPVAAEAPC